MTKAFADTNLFLRFLIGDSSELALRSRAIMQMARKGEIGLVTTPFVFAELVWTLKSYYQRSKKDILTLLLGIVSTPGIEVEERDRVIQALVWYEEKNVDFIDAYHAAWILERPFREVISFDDKHFKRFSHLVVSLPDEA